MDSNAQIVSLIRKKMDGTIIDDELRLLERWAAEDPLHAKLLSRVLDEETVLADFSIWLALRNTDGNGDWLQTLEEKTWAKLDATRAIDRPVRSIIWKRYLSFAALLLSVLGGALWFYQFHLSTQESTLLADLSPGKNKAQITLSDGRIIELSQDQKGVVWGDQLHYEDGTAIQTLDNGKVVYATISTPRGGQYQITLPDGTKVWLNADSELKYPSSFREDARVVQLQGEAYFDVASVTKAGKKIPFIVKSTQQEVEVLGTQFNLKAYADDHGDARTTLVEGAVLLHSASSILRLAPGEQGISGGRGLNKKKVDVGPYIAWKDNRFVFEEVELREALKILSRWYDFDVQIDNKVGPTHLYASISRDKSLKEVLSIIESSGIRSRLERSGQRNKLTIFN